MKLLAILLLSIPFLNGQELTAYRLSEPDAAEGTHLYTEARKAFDTYIKWKAAAEAKYANSKVLDFTFDFRVGVPRKEPKADGQTSSSGTGTVTNDSYSWDHQDNSPYASSHYESHSYASID